MTGDPNISETVETQAETLRAALADYSAGRFDDAVAKAQSLIGSPVEADARHILAMVCMKNNQWPEGEAEADRAIALNPGEASLYYTRGTLRRLMNRRQEAISDFRLATTLSPGYLHAHYNLGILYQREGRLPEAMAQFRLALAVDPQNVDALQNYAACLETAGRRDEAEAVYRMLLDAHPDHAAARSNLGLILCARSRGQEAMEEFRKALEARPNYAHAKNGLGVALAGLGNKAEAEAAYRDAIRMDPAYAEPHNNLASLLQSSGRLEEAIAEQREAIRLKPDMALAYNNMALALASRGQIALARKAYEEAMALDPGNAKMASNHLMCLCYDDEVEPEAVAKAHFDWGRTFGRGRARAWDLSDEDPGRRLKIGYVSPDFRAHSVAFYVSPIIAAQDRNAFEVHCYADIAQPDDTTAHIRARADRWHDVTDLDDTGLAEKIAADGIDILIDLAGHTAGHRLGVFAQKPAPVQGTWIGYPNTTGLEAMDFRITDAEADPPGRTEDWHTEHLERLPTGFLCYEPPVAAPDVAPPPCLENDFITFGSFNNLAKIGDRTKRTWARLLKAVPDSRLLLKARPLGDAGTRDRLLADFAALGIGAERLELVSYVESALGHLDLYRRVDIALDPFPYNGTTTTCEALNMGVPVVTLAGRSHAGRVGLSLLTRVGLEACVAEDEAGYVAIAADLAADPSRLVEWRALMRLRLAGSVLTDAKVVTRAVEAVYRDQWRKKVEGAV